MRAQPRAAIAPVRFGSGALPRTAETTRGLHGDFAWTLVGNLVYAATQWGVLIVIAKFGAQKLVGQFALGLAVCAPVFLLSRLALRPVQATDSRGEYEFGHYLALRMVTLPAALVLVAIIVLTVGYRREVVWVILAVAVAKALESLSDPFYGAFQQRERMDHISKSMIAKGLLALVGFAFVFRLTGSLVWGALVMAVAWLLVLLLYDLRLASTLIPTARPIWEPRALFDLAYLALPVGIATMLLSLNANIPRYYVERFLGETELGLYAAAAYVTVALGTVVNALGQSMSPRLARFYAEGEKDQFTKLLSQFLALGVGLGIGFAAVAALFGREILTLLYQPAYGSGADILLWLSIVTTVSIAASSLGYSLTAARRFRVQPLLFTVSAVVGALAGYFLVPTYGLEGAVGAYGAAAVVLLVGSALFTVRALGDLGSEPPAKRTLLGRRLASVLTSSSLVRLPLRELSRLGLLPSSLWKRLPVEGRFRVLIPTSPVRHFQYAATANDAIGRALFWRGCASWERETIRTFLKISTRATHFLDIGANTGVYTLLACAVKPQLRVLSFEPVPRVHERLQRNIELNGWSHRCDTRNEAVSSFEGQSSFHVPFAEVPTSAGLNPAGFRDVDGEIVEVPVTTVDRACEDFGPVDLAKIDVEGQEHAVLQGMSHVLGGSRPALIIECNPESPYGRVQEMLKAHGYRFFHITDAGLVARSSIVPDATERHRNYLCLSAERLGWIE